MKCLINDSWSHVHSLSPPYLDVVTNTHSNAVIYSQFVLVFWQFHGVPPRVIIAPCAIQNSILNSLWNWELCLVNCALSVMLPNMNLTRHRVIKAEEIRNKVASPASLTTIGPWPNSWPGLVKHFVLATGIRNLGFLRKGYFRYRSLYTFIVSLYNAYPLATV